MARPRTFDEDEVLDAARSAFWNRGYAATSVDDLAAATGLGKGSLYGAFGDKHALFVRALDGYCAAKLADFAAQLRQPGIPAVDRLRGHIRSVVRGIAADSERRGCLMTKSATELGASDVDVDRIVAATQAQWLADLVDCLVEAQADGTVTADADASALATMLLALMRGCEALGKGGVPGAQLRAAGEQAIALVVAS
jgi:TetR/AcrR family transcriptional regulator, transcriptional repressor for nem operon